MSSEDETRADPPNFGSRLPAESSQEDEPERVRSRIGVNQPFRGGPPPRAETPPTVEDDAQPAQDAAAAPAASTVTDPPTTEGDRIVPPLAEDKIEEPPIQLKLRPKPKKKRFETPYPVPENLVWGMGGEKIYGHFGWHWLKREDPEELARRIASDQDDVLYSLVNGQDVGRITTFFCGKGGVGKTTNTAGTCGKFAKSTGLVTVGLDGNKTAGHLARRFGMEVNNTSELNKLHGTLSLMAYLMAVKDGDMQTYARLLQVVQRHHETGAFIIGTDPPKNTAELTQVLFRDGARNLVRREGDKHDGIAHSVFIDTGVDFSSHTNVGAAQVADRYVFTSLASDDEGLDNLGDTMALLSGGTLTEEGSTVPFKQKVDESLITIAGAEHEHLQRYADRYGVDVKRVFPYPLNPYIGSKSSTPIALSMVPWTAQVQINSILIALYDDNGSCIDPANLARAA